MIEIPNEVTVASGHSQKIEGTLTFPEPSFNGLLTAGLHISEKKSKETESAIANTVSYNLPFIVRGNIDIRPKAEITFEKLSIEDDLSTQSSLNIFLSNKEATLLKESDFTAEIKDKNGKTLLKKSSKLDITPETSFIYPIKLPEKIDAGDYQLVLKVKHRTDKWNFKKSFQITNQASKEIYQKKHRKERSWLIYGLFALAFLFIGFFLWTFKKRKASKRNKHLEQHSRLSRVEKRKRRYK